jgi:CRISPR system Cascade subunit CasE
VTGTSTLNTAHLTEFRRELMRRYGGARIERPNAVLEGHLMVRDPVAFRALLARGVGRHRAFGFGMLLLRPPVH